MPSIIADSRAIFLLRRTVLHLLSRVATNCPLCEGRAAGGRLCLGCLSDMTQWMQRHASSRCDCCGLRNAVLTGRCGACATLQPVFSRTIVAFDYEPPFDSLISRYKEEHRFGLSTMLAYLLARALDRSAAGKTVLKAGTLLVPIPSSDASLRKRGFNPAAELARGLGAFLGHPVRRDILRRVREGARQATRHRVARLHAAQGLFVCERVLTGVPIALVDDVMTTGSTVNAAAQALLRAGASDVTVLVAARTPLGN